MGNSLNGCNFLTSSKQIDSLEQYSNHFWSGFSCVVTHIGFGCFQVNQLITVAAVIYTDFLLAGTVPGIPIPTAITDAYNALLLDRPVCSSKKK